MPPQVEPVNTGAVAADVGKLPVGKLENGEAAAVRDIIVIIKLLFVRPDWICTESVTIG
jgi:hypothetical protein